MALNDLNLSDTSSGDLGGYFLVTITDLDLATQYPIQFQYVYADGRTNKDWSAGRYFTTTGATVPNEPQLQTTDVVGGAGFIKVTWSGNDASGNAIENFDRVDVHISGTTFGDGTKPAGSFKTAGTQTFSCVAGIYIVQLKVYSLNGSTSFFSSARTVTVTSAIPAAESSVTPSTPTVSSVLGAIQLAWNGKTSSGGDQPYGFTAAKVYIGTTSGFTPSSSNQVDVLNFANGQNTLNIGVGTIVNGTALDYGIDYYVKIATTNGTDTSTPVSASGNPVQIGKVTSGDIVTVTADKIATGTLSSGSTITVGSTSGKHVKLSGTGDPFIIYGSGGISNPVLSYNGAKLTIVGDGTFSGNLSAAGGTFTGTLSAASGSFSGTITASGGTIGGITIAAAALQNNSAESSSTFKLDSGGKARFGAYSGNAIIIDPSAAVGGYYIYHSSNGGAAASNKFSVSNAGVLTATGATFTDGTINVGSDYWNANGTFRLGGSSGIDYNGSLITLGSNTTVTGKVKVGSSSNYTQIGTNTYAQGSIDFVYGSLTGYIYYSSAGTLYNVVGLSSTSLDTNAYQVSANTIYMYGRGEVGSSWGWGSYSTTHTELTDGVTITSNSVISRRSAGQALFLHRYNASGTVEIARFAYNGSDTGGINVSGSGAAFRTPSDYRLKENIKDYTDSINRIKAIKLRSFNLKSDLNKKQIVGFVAHELAEVDPDLVTGEKDAIDENGDPDYQSIMPGNLVPYLAGALKEAILKIENLEARLDALEA